MKRIYKYNLLIIDEQTVVLPDGSTVLSVDAQKSRLVMYALIEDNMPDTKPTKIRIIGTGHPFPDHREWSHLTTVSTHNGEFIWHVFTEKSKEKREE